MYITFCNSVYEPSNMVWIALDEFLESIRDCRFRNIVDAARGNKWKKRNLPAVAFSTFNNSVANANLANHSGYLHFDIDGVSGAEVRVTVQTIPYVYATWLSPNGGLKGLCSIPVVKNDAEYKLYFKSIDADFIAIGITIDRSCKDVRRFCFLSYDEDLWINDNALTHPQIVQEPCIVDYKTLISHSEVVQSTCFLNSIKDRLNVILHNTQLGEFHAMRYKAGIIIGGLISGGQADDSLIDVFMDWNRVIHSTFDDNASTQKREMKTFFDGLSIGKANPIKNNFLNSKE